METSRLRPASARNAVERDVGGATRMSSQRAGRGVAAPLLWLLLAVWSCGGAPPSVVADSATASARGQGCAAEAPLADGEAAEGSAPPGGAPLPGSAMLVSRISRRQHVEPPLTLDLNIPAYRLDVFETGAPRKSYRVAVGMRQFRTPVGSFAISVIEWNPWWVPPPSPWAAGEKVTPPGPTNPMGRVKLYFRPFYFLHGTPHEESLGTAGSHGCVRMSNADALALARLVQRLGSPETTESEVDWLIADTTTTRRFSLSTPVPLRIRYDLVELRDDSLRFYPDVYRASRKSLSNEALALLSGAGYDTTGVDPVALATAVRQARTHAVTLSLDSLQTLPSPRPE